ncbi:hypothetical protein L6R53_21155 [Myxococcota bacterium]|nr:hypothetical protein [Myxococcota bacterium]
MTDAPAVGAAPGERLRALAWLLPVLVTAALYLPPCFGADWVVDDRPLIPDHLRPGDILGEWRVPTHAHAADLPGYLWRPLTSSLYQVWGEAFGRTPTPFRLLNTLLHTANALLVFAVGRRAGAGARAAALLATAWAVHPLLPDAACWIADTYDLLAASFLLLGLRLSLGQRPALAGRAALGGGLFLLALLSKEASLSWAGALPLVLLLLRGWRPALAHGLVLAPVAALHSAWHGRVVGDFETSAGDLLAAGWRDYLGLWTDYLRWPLHLPVRAGFTHLVQPGAEPLSLLGLAVILVGLLGLGVGGPRGRSVAAAVGTWALMISPGALAALSFGQQSSRYLYMGLALATPLLAGALPRLGRAWAGPALTAAWCLAWLPLTLPRIQAWQSERSLFLDELASEPDNSFAMKGVGRILFGEGQVAQGLDLWARALEQPPASSFVMDPQRERLDLAQAAARVGRLDLARAQVEAFLAEEARQGREIDPSVRALYAALQPPAP